MKKTVLVVEDSKTILFTISRTLQLEGLEVLTADDGQYALDILQTRLPDLIVTDVMMPRVDGYQLHDKVHEDPRTSHIPFIFLTAKGTQEDIRLGKEMGADDYIVKPFSPKDLVSTVRGRLRRIEQLRSHTEREKENVSEQILNYLSQKLRAPLTHMRGWIHQLKESSATMTGEQISGIYTGMDNTAHEMELLLEKFILLTRLEQLTDTDDFMDASSVLLAQEVVQNVISKWMTVLKIVPLMADEPLYIRGQVELLIRALDELLENASFCVKSMDDRVNIRITAESDTVFIVVQDFGYGIAEEDLPKIFHKFFQCESKARLTSGTGLGLSLVKRIVELHRGSVTVSSQIDKGSSFTIALPRFFKTA